jgi:hypothetical protein
VNWPKAFFLLLFSAWTVHSPRAFATSPVASPPDDWTHGKKTLLYIRVNYPDDTNEPISFDDAVEMLQQLDGIFRTNSYGQISIISTVTPLIQMPEPKTNYFRLGADGSYHWNSAVFLNDARNAAASAGLDTKNFDLDAVRCNAPFAQSWGLIGYKGVWLMTSHLVIAVHEIAHNLGLQHANAWQGEIDGPGQNVEYGNPYDFMGSVGLRDVPSAHFSAFGKHQLGWLSDDNVTAVTSSGVYRIYAEDFPARDVLKAYALRIRKDSGRDYWIEKRHLFEDYNLQNGVLVYWSPWSQSNLGTQLLDASSDAGESLPVGVRLSDPDARVHIIPVQQADDHSWIDVAVVLGPETIEPLSLHLLPRRGSSDDPLLYFSGVASGGYTLQASPDLRIWSNNGISPATGSEFFVPVTSTDSSKFFRLQY